MDAKALAKSKRAHSQHHKNKSYPHQKSKAPSVPSVSSDNTGNPVKPPGKQAGEKTRQAQRIARLPSNWDRYKDEFNLDTEDQSGDGTSQYSDVILPKSKGADYSYLIAEAQSQALSQSYSCSDIFPSWDDVMPGGFIEGVGSMLSVKGEGILSWTGDDNFIVEDKTMRVKEASFLSLNLNALAEQLAKVELPQRLFVEADLFPLELDAEGSIASSTQESNKTQTKHETEAAAHISEDVAFNDVYQKVKIENTEFTSFGSHTCHKDATFSSREPDLVNQVKDNLSSIQFGRSGQSRGLEHTTQVKENSASVSNRRLLKFEAAACEAELDMLLDSFSDNKFIDSSGYKASNTFPKSEQVCSTAPPQVSGKGLDLSKTAAVTASFDDVLDDLLEETSNLMNQNSLSQSQDVKVVSHVTRSPQVSGKGPDSSKTAAVTASFDDVLDDLLEETSNLMNQNNLAQSQDVKVVSHVTRSSHSVTKSKVLDDFDSWLDTI